MADQFDRIALSNRISKYTRGASQGFLERMRIANFVAPVVTVGGIKFEYWQYDSRNGYRIPKTQRALHGTATILDTGGQSVQDRLQPNALDVSIDEAEEAAGDLYVTLKNKADEALEAAGLSHENNVIQTALTGAGAGTDYNASQASTIDLKNIFDQAILDLVKRTKTGSDMGVRILFGPSAGVRFANHQSIRGLFKGGRRDTATPPIEDVTDLLLAKPRSMHSLTVLDSAAEGQAESTNWLTNMDNSVLIFMASDRPGQRDPSYMKTFALNEAIIKGGAYESVDGRQRFSKLDWYVLPKVVNSTAVTRINLNAS